MKKQIALLIVGVLLANLPISAHPGKTDGDGGHYNRSTGEYHYHHGFSAHQHTDGVCPYDFQDRTSHSSGGSSNKNGVVIDDLFDEPVEYLSQKKKDTTPKKLSAWKEILYVVGIYAAIFYVPWMLVEGVKWIKNHINNKRK